MVARENFVTTQPLQNVAGDVVYVMGFFIALMMWGFGLVWLVFALATIYKSRPFPFNMGVSSTLHSTAIRDPR